MIVKPWICFLQNQTWQFFCQEPKMNVSFPPPAPSSGWNRRQNRYENISTMIKKATEQVNNKQINSLIQPQAFRNWKQVERSCDCSTCDRQQGSRDREASFTSQDCQLLHRMHGYGNKSHQTCFIKYSLVKTEPHCHLPVSSLLKLTHKDFSKLHLEHHQS